MYCCSFLFLTYVNISIENTEVIFSSFYCNHHSYGCFILFNRLQNKFVQSQCVSIDIAINLCVATCFFRMHAQLSNISFNFLFLVFIQVILGNLIPSTLIESWDVMNMLPINRKQWKKKLFLFRSEQNKC